MRISYFPDMLEKEDHGPNDYSGVPVLLVDDEPVALELCSKLLGRLGFSDIDMAPDGVAALKKMMDRKYAVVISDWNMPEMSGLEFVTAVRAEPRYRSMTLMMVTTEGEQAQIVRALAAGAHEYVIKPFSDEVIAEKLALLGLVAA